MPTLMIPDGHGNLRPALAKGTGLVTLGSTSGYAGWVSPAVGPSAVWKMPTADGAGFLKSDGSLNTSWSTTLPSITIASGTIVSNATGISITQTWNNSGVTFDAPLFMSITNSASHSGSLLADFQVGGSPVFQVDKSGWVGIAGTAGSVFPLMVTGPSSSPNNGAVFTTNSFTIFSSGSGVRIGTGATSGNTYGMIDVITSGGNSGTGSLSLSPMGGKVGIGLTGPSTTFHVFGGASTFEIDAIITSQTPGIIQSNTTLSTNGVTVQNAPARQLTAHAWNTTSVAADNYVEFLEQVRATSGTAPSGAYVISSRISTGGTGAWVDRVSIYDNGDWTINDNGTFFYFSGGRFLVGTSDATGTNTGWLKATAFLSYGSGGIGFSSAGSAANDSNITRLGAASLALGNGTQGDFSGSLKLGTIQATTAYKSSDGSAGATGTATAANTLTIKNGLITNIA